MADGTQAITAVHNGYSKKLRFLEPTHTCSVGVMNELIEANTIKVEYAPTLAHAHSGDGFTEVMTPAKFLAAREMMGLVDNS